MSIIKIKINLAAEYDSVNAHWTIAQGDIAHIRPGDALAVLSSEGWSEAPASVTATAVAEASFTTDSSPASDASAVFVKTYVLSDPMSLQWDISDVDSSDGSGTNQLGVVFRDRIATKRTLTCAWGALNQTEMAALLSAMTDVFFDIEFPDALKGTSDTMEVYVSNRSAPLYQCVSGSDWKWTSMSVTFTER